MKTTMITEKNIIDNSELEMHFWYPENDNTSNALYYGTI